MTRGMRRLAASIGLALLASAARDVVASTVVDFARCLDRKGAVYYTADWCPHCARQNRMFGAALRYLRVVDCTNGCDGIRSLPTWRFGDGTSMSGVASFEVLASRTGCKLDTGGDEPGERGAAPSPTRGPNVRYQGGAQIIEVR